MAFERELLFFFSGLGVFNGLLLSAYFLFWVKPRHISNYFLGAFLLSLSIRIGKSIFFYFNPELAYGYLQLGLTGCFFIGPFLYFYLRSVLHSNKWINKGWVYHMVVLVPVILIVGWLYPFEYNIDLWRNWIIYSIYMIWLGYSILAGLELKSTFKKVVDSNANVRNLDRWTLGIWIGNMLIWTAYFFTGITSYILGALLFSFVLYLLVFLLFFSSKKDPITYKPSTSKSPNTQKEVEILLKQLKTLMKEKQLYKNPNLKLAEVAQLLKVPPSNISQALNNHLGYGFPHFLNTYRIEEAKRLLATDEILTYESLGYESGFNSKSSFFATFKKFTGTTPAKFKTKLTGSINA